MFKRWKLLLGLLLGLVIVLFGVAMLDPFFRQLVFGPKYDGIPLVTWQKFFREWDVIEAHPEKPSFLDNVHEAVLMKPSPTQWARLSGEDRRAILLTLVHGKEIVRMHVAHHLRDVPASPEVIAQLGRYAQDDAARVRQYAGMSLAKFAAEAPEAVVPTLVGLIETSDAPGRLVALQVLSRMKSLPQEAVSPIIVATNDRDAQVQAAANSALWKLGPDAIPALVKLRSHESAAARRTAEKALSQIDPVQFPPK